MRHLMATSLLAAEDTILQHIAQKLTTLQSATRFWDDIFAFLILAPIAWSLIASLWLPQKPEPGFDQLFLSPQRLEGQMGSDEEKKSTKDEIRDVNLMMKQNCKDVIIFWGSQSGRATQLAKQLARQLQTKYAISAVAEDLDSFDHHSLENVTRHKVVGFIVSTFGEGDPPDNAAGLWEYLQTIEGRKNALPHLNFFIFGLGSSQYQHYNKFADLVNDTLSKAGAHRLGSIGKLDAATGLEDAWIEWKAEITHLLSARVPASAVNVQLAHESDIDVVELSPDGTNTRLAPLAADLHNLASHGRTQTYVAPVSNTRRLSAATGRTYLQIEFNWGQAGNAPTYETGDHLAVWPMNSDQEVELWAQLFGWDRTTLQVPIQINPRSSATDMSSLPLGQTSRDSILRYCLDICGPVSQDTLSMLTHFAPTHRSKTYLEELSRDKSQWKEVISSYLTLGKLMRLADSSPEAVWPSAMFPIMIQTVALLQPRYFSISSSPLVSKNKITITVGVLNSTTTSGDCFYGLTTNYLLAIHHHHQGSESIQPRSSPTFSLDGPRQILSGGKSQVHVRRSNFRPPRDCAVPIVMVAAGSGIAPFLAFSQERAQAAKSGKEMGKTTLFFGCRSPTEDYLYRDEWSRLQSEHQSFSIHVAFSRTTSKKEYVQHKIAAEKVKVLDTLHNGGCLYICGSVLMAQEVKKILIESLVESGWEIFQAENFLAKLKLERRIQEDVWA